MSETIAVMGAGSWGTAVAITLASAGNTVKLWDRKPDLVAEMNSVRENKKYLPGAHLPENLTACSDEQETLRDAGIAVYVVPAQSFRGVFQRTCGFLEKDAIVVNCAKGIEQKSLLLMSQVAREIKPDVRYAVVSGPSHAEEVGLGMPTTLAVASDSIEDANRIQDAFMTDALRMYTNSDITGVELGGALKNIIAMGAGILDGLGYGDNAKAALMTRGIAEIRRLGLSMGANPETFNGLTGIGDLIVTCTSMHSRNRRCGILIGQGVTPDEATKQVGMVVEGMYTTEAAYQLAQRNGVEMPITEQIYMIINEGKSAREGLLALMRRKKKHEDEESQLSISK